MELLWNCDGIVMQPNLWSVHWNCDDYTNMFTFLVYLLIMLIMECPLTDDIIAYFRMRAKELSFNNLLA